MTGYYDTHSRAFVSRDGNSTYLAVAVKPTDDKAAAGRRRSEIANDLAGRAGRRGRRYALAQEQVNKQVEKDLRRPRCSPSR